VLAVAHRRGVVHRDLSARNIMVSPAGIKIIDFGLATAALRSGDSGAHPVVIRRGTTRANTARSALAHSGPLQGGPLQGGPLHGGPLHGGPLHGGSWQGDERHDSPRHSNQDRSGSKHDGPRHGTQDHGDVRRGNRDHGDDALPSHPKTAFARPADDVYTLGVLLYEMLTGRSPYPPAVAAMIVTAGRAGHLAPTPVLTIPGLPPPLRDLVRACMAKRPEDRPPSVDVALDLWRMLDGVRLPEPSVN
jgi:serine/threonine protein kinase